MGSDAHVSMHNRRLLTCLVHAWLMIFPHISASLLLLGEDPAKSEETNELTMFGTAEDT